MQMIDHDDLKKSRIAEDENMIFIKTCGAINLCVSLLYVGCCTPLRVGGLCTGGVCCLVPSLSLFRSYTLAVHILHQTQM